MPHSTPAELPYQLRRGESLAILLLFVGCLTGMGILIRAGDRSSPPRTGATAPGSADSRQELVQRIRELELRLLEAVPVSVERKYRDL